MDPLRVLPWIVRVSWAVVPILAGPAFETALTDHSIPVRTVASVLLWAGWAVAMCATLVLHPVSLTVLRLLVPAATVAAAWTAVQEAGTQQLTAIAVCVLVVALAFLPETALLFVNGPAYPGERRFPLRAPGPLLVGPLGLAWGLTVGLPVSAALLLAAQQWVAGGVVAALAVAAVWILGRALHGLSRRWLVFVPAGVVVHDAMALADPMLFRRQTIASMELAPAGTTAVDLTQRALGLAIEINLREDTPLVLSRPRARIGPTVSARAVLVSPTRPGRVLREARSRRT